MLWAVDLFSVTVALLVRDRIRCSVDALLPLRGGASPQETWLGRWPEGRPGCCARAQAWGFWEAMLKGHFVT